MDKISTRELWAKQSLLLKWKRDTESDDDWIRLAGRELMRRTKGTK